MQKVRDFLDTHCGWLSNLLWGEPHDFVWVSHKDHREMVLDLRNHFIQNTGHSIQYHACDSYMLEDGTVHEMEHGRLIMLARRSGGLLSEGFMESKSILFTMQKD